MNQQEYELIAKVIHQADKKGYLMLEFTLMLASELEKTYSSFDREKFLKACEL